MSHIMYILQETNTTTLKHLHCPMV